MEWTSYAVSRSEVYVNTLTRLLLFANIKYSLLVNAVLLCVCVCCVLWGGGDDDYMIVFQPSSMYMYMCISSELTTDVL